MSSKQAASKPWGGDSPPPSVKRRRVWARRLLLVAGSTTLALVLGEIAVRVLGVGPQLGAVSAAAFRLSENRVLGYEFLPGALDGATKINPDGMRDRRRDLEKPPATFRIACIGDSISAGFKMPVEEAFPARLERLLNRYYAAPDLTFEVLNLGVTGYNITQAIENLRVRGLKYEPDLIVYAFCLNDVEVYSYEFEALLSKLTAAQRSYFSRAWGTTTRLAQRSRLYALWRYARESNTAAGDLRSGVRPDVQFRHLGDNTYGQYFRSQYDSREGWHRVTAGLAGLDEVSRRLNISTYVVIFPAFPDLAAYALEDVHRKVAAAARQRSLRALDLLDDYRLASGLMAEPLSQDYLHPNGAGHQLAAVAILRELLAHEPIFAAGADLHPVATGDQPEAPLAALLLEADATDDDTAPAPSDLGRGA